jgi:hypothetical protein
LGLLTVKPPGAAANPREFYWIQLSRSAPALPEIDECPAGLL